MVGETKRLKLSGVKNSRHLKEMIYHLTFLSLSMCIVSVRFPKEPALSEADKGKS